MSAKLAVFRCDASYAMGTGHVVRCLTLADELSRRGWACAFWTDAETREMASALIQNGHRIVGQWNERADILIADHYGLDTVFEKKCRTWASRILVIDDLANRLHDCDVLMDQTFGRPSGDYKKLVPEDCRILTGPEYALLRPQFSAAREKSLARRATGRLERIMVSAGGANTHNITSRILDDLSRFSSAPLAIDVVLGKAAAHIDTVRGFVNHINDDTRHEAVFHVGVDDMAALMAKADLAVGAAGTSSWERCCLGLPTVMIELAENQKTIAANLRDARAALNLGWHADLSGDVICRAVTEFYHHPEKLVSMSVNAAKICDGRGVGRLAGVIENVVL